MAKYIKVAGTWEGCTASFIKAGGTWTPVLQTFRKVGGQWVADQGMALANASLFRNVNWAAKTNPIPRAVAFKPFGEQYMYLVGSNGAAGTVVSRWVTSIPLDLATVTEDTSARSADLDVRVVNAVGLQFPSDGSKMIFLESSGQIDVVPLSTAWDPSSANVIRATLTNLYNVTGVYGSADTNYMCFGFNRDGTRLFAVYYYSPGGDYRMDSIALNSAWEINSSTMTFESRVTIDSLVTGNARLRGLGVSLDERKLYAAALDKVVEFEMSTPGDITTMTSNATYTIANDGGWLSGTLSPTGVDFVFSRRPTTGDDYSLAQIRLV